MGARLKVHQGAAAEEAERDRKSIMVDADVHFDLKRLAHERGVLMHDLTRELLLWALKEESKAGKTGKASRKP